MYNIFKLPEDFLSREYTADEMNRFDDAIHQYITEGKTSLSEELTDKQKKRVDKMYGPWGNIKNAHDAVFGKGNDRIEIPYDQSKDIPITSSNYQTTPEMNNLETRPIHHTIIPHLLTHGYETDDYGSGLAYHVDEPKRKLKISSILQKIGTANNPSGHMSKGNYGKESVNMTMEQAYAADPVRAAFKKDKKIIITRNKYDVAGMSTDRGWKSCMDMEDGSNRHYLRHDIEQGTLTAYICTTDDSNIKHPIGRINLKQFKNVGTGHMTFIPENSRYGTIPTSFPAKVKEWADASYPLKDAGVYMKQRSLYDDDGRGVVFHNIHEIDPHKEIHRHVESLYDSIARPYKDGDVKDYYGVSESIQNGIMDHHYKLTPKQKAHSIIHWTSDSAYEHDGDGAKDIDDIDSGNLHGNEPLHSVFESHIQSSRGGRETFQRDLKSFDPTDAIVGLEKIHKGMHKSGYGDHVVLKKVHGDLIDHIYSHHEPEWDHVKEHVANHIADSNNNEYYYGHEYEAVSDNSDTLNRTPLTMLSKNPRTMHTLLDNEKHTAEWNSSTNSLEDSEALEHIGRHTDVKLANHFLHERDDVDSSHHYSFFRGLKDNPNSENIQHTLLNKMHLDSGDEHTEKHADTINSIASSTQHKSVFDRIHSRTKGDLSFAKDALKDNTTFGRSVVMESYTKYLSKKPLHTA